MIQAISKAQSTLKAQVETRLRVEGLSKRFGSMLAVAAALGVLLVYTLGFLVLAGVVLERQGLGG